MLSGKPRLLAACDRAGFTHLRDVARPTAAQLVSEHKFTLGEAEELHEYFAESDHSEEVSCGDDFISLALMYINDARGGEGNPQRAKKELQSMFGKPYPNRASIDELAKELSESRSSRFATRAAAWREAIEDSNSPTDTPMDDE